MPSYSRPLHQALTPYVGSWVGYDYRLDPAALHHGVAGTSLTVIIAFDEPLDCGWLDLPDSGRRFWTLVSGLHRRPALIRTHGHQVGLQLGLTPLGLRALLGLPAGACAGQLLGPDEIALVPPGGHERLQLADWPTRFDLLEQYLLQRLTPVQLRPEVGHAWRRLAGPARVTVDGVAAEIGWSRRHLRNVTSAEFGLSPQRIIRLGRFERAHSLARTGRSLADVAATSGYADQAHLTRDWREFAGGTPRQTLAEFPTVQEPLESPAG